ncbi:hypothetical protein FWF74_00540 [Candidatus Saccharibacteria bacterium]|nr:hypothetical protein [Candidatus Saccharibacteria bacterium]MCL1963337.1 hypothetical protein [Candidatus Saccharibacteria bacterium]
MKFENTGFNTSDGVYNGLSAEHQQRLLDRDALATRCLYYVSPDCAKYCPNKNNPNYTCPANKLQLDIAAAEGGMGMRDSLASNDDINTLRSQHPIKALGIRAINALHRGAIDSYHGR